MKRQASHIVIGEVIGLVFLLLIGCATPGPVGPIPDKGLLDFLEEGKTIKQTVFEKLGQPSGTFENGRILTYRIGSEEEKGYFIFDAVPRPGWYKSKFSLVLVFDAYGVLVKKSLVSVR
jgi:hypothetical protein